MDTVEIVIALAAFLFALSFHECAHAYSAFKFGDPTPKLEGRITLNPLAHIDPFGTVIFPILLALSGLTPFGWAKPVRINPYNMRDPEKHLMMSTACGPLSNLALGTASGLLCGVALAIVPPGVSVFSVLVLFLQLLTIINYVLALFNLIPLGPLDGHAILRHFLPHNAKVRYHTFNERYGTFVLLGLFMLTWFGGPNIITLILRPAHFLSRLVINIPYAALESLL